jgi:hypothetical protein
MPIQKTRGSRNGHEGICATIEPTRTSRSDPVSATSVLNDVEATVDESAVGAELDELQGLEQSESDQPTMVVPVVIPPTPQPTEDEPISPQRRQVLEHLTRHGGPVRPQRFVAASDRALLHADHRTRRHGAVGPSLRSDHGRCPMLREQWRIASGSWNLRTTPESELSDGWYDRTVA